MQCGRPFIAIPATTPRAALPSQPILPGDRPGFPISFPYLPAPIIRRVSAPTLLSATFAAFAKHFPFFFLVSLILATADAVFNGFLMLAVYGRFLPASGFLPGFPPAVPQPVDLSAAIFHVILFLGAGVFIGSLGIGGMTEYVIRKARGEAVSAERVLLRGLAKFPSVVGGNLLLTLIMLCAFFIPLIILSTLFNETGSPAAPFVLLLGSSIAFPLGSPVALYLVVAMSLYPAAIMMENTDAAGGLMRSWRLIRHHWWEVFGAFLVLAVLALLVWIAIIVPLELLGNPIASLVASLVLGGLIGPWFLILPAIAYDLLARPGFIAPPLVPASPITPPVGALQPPPPPAPPPPSSP